MDIRRRWKGITKACTLEAQLFIKVVIHIYMFGMSFGNTAPENREHLSQNQEVIDTLLEFGFISSPQGVTPEDVVAIQARTKEIQKASPLLSFESATSLAFVDRMVAIQKELGNTQAVESLISKIDTDLVSTLVKEGYAKDEEFLKTILVTALNSYASDGYPAFSDALLSAVVKREHDIEATPTPHGMIDGQDNVVQPTDKILQ